MRGKVTFKYLPWRGESEKFEKAGGSTVQGQVFLKGEAGTFPIYFFQVLSFFYLETTLPLISLKNIYIFFKNLYYNFRKKGHSKLSKNESENIL